MIDKNWIHKFKIQCKYDSVKKILKEKNEYNSDYNKFVNNFSKQNPLQYDLSNSKPRPPLAINISSNEYYYDNYEFLDKKTLDIFFKTFNFINNNKEFMEKEAFMLGENTFMIIIDKNMLEIIKIDENHDIKERYLFSVKKNEDLGQLKNLFISSNLDKAFSNLNITNKNNSEQSIFLQKELEIVKMRNILIFSNLNRYNLEKNFNNNRINLIQYNNEQYNVINIKMTKKIY